MCQCSNNPCGCAGEIELPYINGINGTNGTNGTNGINGVDAPAIASIDTAIVGSNLVFTFNFDDESTVTASTALTNVSKAYVLQSVITDPYITQKTTGFLGDITESLLTVPINTLSVNGDSAKFVYVLKASSTADEVVNIQLNDNTLTSQKLNQGLTIVTIEVSRVSTTSLHYVIHWEEMVNAATNTNSNIIVQGFISVSDITTNTFYTEIEIGAGITSGVTVDLVKCESVIIKK
jgi:hypothetical protein